jgi:glycyl-tRNA synthetase
MPVPAALPCRYSEDVTYGELFLQNEYEMSCYNLDEADVAEQRKRFNLYEAEVSPAALPP